MNVEWFQRISPSARIVGHGGGQSSWSDPRRVIYDHELMCFGKGGMQVLEIEGTPYECPENSFIVIPPGRWHVGRGSSPFARSRAWVHFDWEFSPRPPGLPILTYAPALPRWRLMRPAPRYVPSVVFHGRLRSPATVFEVHERLEELFERGDTRERLLSRGLLLELLLSLLLPEEGTPRRVPSGRDASGIRQALDVLAGQPFRSAPAIRSWLGRLGRSYDHQARLFRNTYGVTPLQYVNAQRMERAKSLLRDTDLPVSQVAYRLGFEDVVYFNRLFRKVVANTPGQYRRAARVG